MSKEPENTVRQQFEAITKVYIQIPNGTAYPVVAEQIINPDPDLKWVCSLTYEAPLLKIESISILDC